MNKRQLIMLALAAAMIVAAVLWAVKSLQQAATGPAPVQPDSMVYFQYARAISEGHAYRFTPGQDESTGSTSHLYPFVLSLLIQIGGLSHLETASFMLNAACHAATLVLVVLIALRLKPRAAPVALLLAALGGHLAMTVHSDCDMSLFVPLALGIFYAAICGRPSWLGITLVIAPWARPEGAVLAATMLVAFLAGWILNRDERKKSARLALAAAAGVASAILMAVWNHHLTGAFGFQSTAHKDWFSQYPWTGALMRSAQDFMALWSGAFWGTGVNGGARAMLGVPLLGAVLFIAGFATKPRDTTLLSAAQNGWLAGVVAATGLVAISGWSGAVFDRYLGWISPFVCIYAAMGLVAIADALKSRAVLAGGAFALAVIQATGAAWFLGIFGANCAETSALASFARGALHAEEHEGKHDENCNHQRVLTVGEAGLAFYLDASDVMNLNGIVSPHMSFIRSPIENIERLKHWSWRRAPLLLLSESQTREPGIAPLVGVPVVLQDPLSLRESKFGIYQADYSIFAPAAARPLRQDVVTQVAGMTNVFNLEIGFAVFERKAGRRVSSRTASFTVEPFASTGLIGTNRILEVGDVVLGSETFTIAPTIPGRALRCVMRTAGMATASLACADGTSRSRSFAFGTPMRLTIACGGKSFEVERPLAQEKNAFDEIVFDIPAGLITGRETQVTIAGDHVALAYWFFQ